MQTNIMSLGKWSFILCLCSIFAVQEGLARDVSPTALSAEILLKLIALNDSLDLAGVDTVRIAVLYDPSDNTSVRQAAIYDSLLSQFPLPPFSGRPLAILRQSNRNLTALSRGKMHAIIVIPGRDNRLSGLREVCNRERILSMTTDSTLVSQGISAGVEINAEGKPEIWFNIKSLKDESAKYSMDVLKLAKHLIFGN